MEPVTTRAIVRSSPPTSVYSYCGEFLGVAVKFSRSVSRYARTHRVAAMTQDLRRLLKRHPGPSIAFAAALGLVVGRVLFRKQ